MKTVGSVTFLKRSSESLTGDESSYQAVSVLQISEEVFNSVVYGDNIPSKSTFREVKITGKEWNKLPIMSKLHMFYRDHAHDARVDAHRIELTKF